MTKKVSKVIVVVMLLLGMAGCAGLSPSKEAKETLQATQGYHVGQVNVTLAEHTFYDFTEEQKHYPNKKELSLLFKDDIEKYLRKAGKSCESGQGCLTLDVDINYLRNFNIGSVSTSAPIFDRTIAVHKGNAIVYTNTQKGLKPNKGGVMGNALNELAVFTKAGEEKPNLEEEREYIDVISQITVKDVLQLSR